MQLPDYDPPTEEEREFVIDYNRQQEERRIEEAINELDFND